MKRKSLFATGIVAIAATTLAVAHAQQIGHQQTGRQSVPVAIVETPPQAIQPMAAPVQALSFQVAAPMAAISEPPAAVLPPEAAEKTSDAKNSEVAVAPHAAAPVVPAPPVITLVAKIDLARQRLTVVENGTPRFTWVISSGAKGFDTPRGTFQPEWMAKDWFSRKYDNAPMPFSVFFKDGAAVHATMNTGTLGIPASHGCVRLSKPNAALFFSLVQRHGMKHTRIQVFGVPRHDPDLVASRARPAGQTTRVAMANPYPAPISSRPIHYGAPFGGYGGYGSAVARPAYRSAPLRVVQMQPSRRY